MLEFLGAGENLAFVVALVIMLLIGAVEAIGLGVGSLGHDFHVDTDGDWLGWLGFGKLPLLMLLVVFLACFGIIGLIGQQLALDHLGRLLPALIAAPAAGVAALPVTGLAARLLARVMPRDETTAIDIGQLVGLHAQITVGRATQGSPAKARVRDFHGQSHYVMVEPDDPAAAFAEGDEILLVRREGHVFRAISSDRPPFSNWIAR
ncbi:YqiJ family protein [Flavisphingomonas formosensis]|uniref:YqiJ family protein n=1 Tax=Flavisphingomonas formosensis TaxID=861534 RepID=UPI0012FC6299|nr:YqiJ family protein [Sphingomonas formosensis]